MHIVAISDLHGFLPEIPECDVLAIAGDICPLGNHSSAFQEKWMWGPFYDWLRETPAKRRVGVGGNHDFYSEAAPEVLRSLPWTYLVNEHVVIDDVMFWGSPLSPTFGEGWAWNASEATLEDVYGQIPRAADVLITHGPPYGVRDRTYFDDQVGSLALREAIRRVQPLLNICGHIHPGYGVDAVLYEGGRTVVGNASIVNGLYEHVNEPLQFRLSKEARYVQQLQ